jgi:outer membrane receptor for Fe3+-dicitrate
VTVDPEGVFHDSTFSNNRVPAVPQHLLACIMEYKYKFGKNIYGLLQWDFDYVTRMFADDMNSEQTETYLYANPMGGINLILGNLSILLSGGVKNVFNKKYVGFININSDPNLSAGKRRYYELGEPRSGYLNLNLTYRF